LGYQVRRGKLGFRVGDRIKVVCPQCKEEREVVSRGVREYTKLCRSCATNNSHKDNPRIGRAESHYNWKGGVNLNRCGYIVVYVKKTHPYYPMAANSHAAGGYILEHRLVMATHLGRCLKPFEVVHHVDGNKQNNQIQNLKLTVRQKHGLSYAEAYQDGYKQGYEEARQKYDIGRKGYINVDKFYPE